MYQHTFKCSCGRVHTHTRKILWFDGYISPSRNEELNNIIDHYGVSALTALEIMIEHERDRLALPKSIKARKKVETSQPDPKSQAAPRKEKTSLTEVEEELVGVYQGQSDLSKTEATAKVRSQRKPVQEQQWQEPVEFNQQFEEEKVMDKKDSPYTAEPTEEENERYNQLINKFGYSPAEAKQKIIQTRLERSKEPSWQEQDHEYGPVVKKKIRAAK